MLCLLSRASQYETLDTPTVLQSLELSLKLEWRKTFLFMWDSVCSVCFVLLLSFLIWKVEQKLDLKLIQAPFILVLEAVGLDEAALYT